MRGRARPDGPTRHTDETADVSNIKLVDDTTTAPAVTAGPPAMSDADRAALRRAVEALEKPGLAARLSALAGAPLDIIGGRCPPPSPMRSRRRPRARCAPP